METKIYYSVTYYSPGTLFSEQDNYDFDDFDLKKFINKAKNIKQRYGASPYGFSYQKLKTPLNPPKLEGFKVNVEPKTLEKSGMFYITGDIIFSKDLVGNDERILRGNLENNYDGIGIVNRNSYKFHAGFNEKDCIINWDGVITRRGNDKDLADYRKKIKNEN